MGRRKMDSELHRIKLETGTVYQTSKGGNYYFRYQINGERKCVSLKTANQEEAIRKARELLPIVQATNPEVIATHVKIARKMAAQIRSLPVSKIWETYANHPNRALPATVREQLSYEATLEDAGRSQAQAYFHDKMGHSAVHEYLQTLRRWYKVKRREAPPSQPTCSSGALRSVGCFGCANSRLSSVITQNKCAQNCGHYQPEKMKS